MIAGPEGDGWGEDALVGDLLAELFFQSHHEFHGVERISAQVFNKLGFRGHLIRVDAKLFYNNVFYSLLN